MGVRSTLPSTGYSFEIPPGTYAPTWNEQQIIYVGKHGNDANTGQSIYDAKLTIQAGITQAVADGAVVNNDYAVTVLDAGDYAEDLTLVSYVHVFAPDATLSGTIIAAAATMTEFRVIAPPVPGGAPPVGYLLNVGGSAAWLSARVYDATNTSHAILVQQLNDNLTIDIDTLIAHHGIGIQDDGRVVGRIGRFNVTGTSVAISRPTTDNVTSLTMEFFGDVNAGQGSLINGQAGDIVLQVGHMHSNTAGGGAAWTLGAAGGLAGTVGHLTHTGGAAGPTRVVNATAVFSLNVNNFGYPFGRQVIVPNGASPYAVFDEAGSYFLDTSAGAVNANLPTAAGRKNQRFEFKWTVGAGAATVTPQAGDQIDLAGAGVAFTFATVNDAITLLSDGVSNWNIV